MRRILFFFNLIATLSCAAFALFEGFEAYGGYFFLAAFQLITTLIVSFIAFSENQKCGFTVYWLLVLAFFILAGSLEKSDSFLLITPMLIALYNCYTYYNFYRLKL